MPKPPDPKSVVRFSVTPRFEVFYALRALGERNPSIAEWQGRTARKLPRAWKQAAGRIAPRPIIWVLLADVLRDAKSDAAFGELVKHIRKLDDLAFQKAILGGVFRDPKRVQKLTSGKVSLPDAVAAEASSGDTLLSLVGLDPFDSSSPAARAFSGIVSDPASYRANLASVLEAFWDASFNETWNFLQPRMQRLAHSMGEALANTSVAEFVMQLKLPVALDNRAQTLVSLRGTASFRYTALKEIHVIPSAFNDGRFWAAYSDDAESVRLFFPVLNQTLLRADVPRIDPALAFRALGDTTRYAIASLLAQSPQTSVELARAFGVSKATISHHVQLLRTAGLLHELPTNRGIVLTLDRDTLEAISDAAATEMFAGGVTPALRRSRHEKPPPNQNSHAGAIAGSPGAEE